MAPSLYSIDLIFKINNEQFQLPIEFENQFDVLYFGLTQKHDFTIIANVNDMTKNFQIPAHLRLFNEKVQYGCNLKLTENSKFVLQSTAQLMTITDVKVQAKYEHERFQVNLCTPEPLIPMLRKLPSSIKEMKETDIPPVYNTLEQLIHGQPRKLI